MAAQGQPTEASGIAPWAAETIQRVLDARVLPARVRTPRTHAGGAPAAPSPGGAASPAGTATTLDLTAEAAEIAAEMGESGVDITDASVAERFVVARLFAPSTTDGLQWLLQSYERAVELVKNTPRSLVRKRDAAPGARDKWRTAVATLRDLLVRYACIVLTSDDDSGGTDSLERLLQLIGNGGLPQGFLPHIVRLLSEAGEDAAVSIEELFGSLFSTLHARFAPARDEDGAGGVACRGVAYPGPARPDGARLTAANSFSEPLRALRALVAEEAVAPLLVRDEAWLPEPHNAAQLARDSILGRILAVGPQAEFLSAAGQDLALEIVQKNGKLVGPQAAAFNGQVRVVREGLGTLRSEAFALVDTLLRKKAAREATLSWFGTLLQGSGGRAKISFHRHLNDAATEDVPHCALMANVSSVLMRLCRPFMDPQDKKSTKIDLRYLIPGATKRFTAEGPRLAVIPSEESEPSPGSTDAATGGAAGGAGGAVVGSADATDGDATAEPGDDGGGDDGGSAGGAWVDPRNLARARQFENVRRAQLHDALAAVPDAVRAAAGGAAKVDESTKFGTISEFFGLALHSLHVGLMQSIAKLRTEKQAMGDILQARQRLVAALEGVPPHQAFAGQMRLNQLELIATRVSRRQMLLTPLVQDDAMVSDMFSFYHLVCVVMLRAIVADPAHPDAPATAGVPVVPLPLPVLPPLLTKLPEYIVDDVATFLLLFGREVHLGLLAGQPQGQLSTYITFLSVFLASPVYVHNPYTRARLVDALLTFVPPSDSPFANRGVRTPPPIFRELECNAMALAVLPKALPEFFVAIEFTGSHTAFYDKFRYRASVMILWEWLWQAPGWADRFVEESKQPSFLRFLNMLANDVLYHMDEAKDHLATVRRLQRERPEWSALEASERAEKQRQLEAESRQARSSVHFSERHLSLLATLTSRITEPFLSVDLRTRVSELCDYFLDLLVGRSSIDLKVENMTELSFDPREVLFLVVQIFTNIASSASAEGAAAFAAAVARDERYYKQENFGKAAKVLSNNVGFIQRHRDVGARVEGLRKFAEAVKAAAAVQKEEDDPADIEEAPEEFVCVLSGDLLHDAVQLPSGNVVSEAFMKRQLLNDPSDPFTRAPLSEADLVPDVELRARVAAYKESRRAARRAAREAASAGADGCAGSDGAGGRDGDSSNSPDTPVGGVAALDGAPNVGSATEENSPTGNGEAGEAAQGPASGATGADETDRSRAAVVPASFAEGSESQDSSDDEDADLAAALALSRSDS